MVPAFRPPRVPPVEVRREELLGIVDALGTREIKKVEQAERRLNVYSEADIADVLLCYWGGEEVQRRHKEKIARRLAPVSLGFFLLAGVAIFVGSYLAKQTGEKMFGSMWAVFNVCFQLTNIIGLKYRMGASVRQKGMVHLLTRYADAHHVSMLIDSLAFSNENREVSCDVKVLLTRLLPAFRDTDAAPLDLYQRKTLLEQLKRGIGRQNKRSANALTADDTAFLSVVRDYLAAAPAGATRTEPAADAEVKLLARWRQPDKATDTAPVRSSVAGR